MKNVLFRTLTFCAYAKEEAMNFLRNFPYYFPCFFKLDSEIPEDLPYNFSYFPLSISLNRPSSVININFVFARGGFRLRCYSVFFIV